MEINGMPASLLPPVSLPLTVPKTAQGATDAASAKKVAREFEAMFIGMMLKSMRETVGEDKLTGGGRGEETFRSLLDQEYAQSAAKNGGVWLAQMIERQLTGDRQAAQAARTAQAAQAAAKGGRDAD